jgi:hypothetical protein
MMKFALILINQFTHPLWPQNLLELATMTQTAG